jgi:hypothetical protein
MKKGFSESIDVGRETEGPLWHRQCARNLMDCYATGMEALAENWNAPVARKKIFETLTRLMVEGMTAVRTAEDERAFYRMATAACRECIGIGGTRAGIFRIYAGIFGDMAGQEE